MALKFGNFAKNTNFKEQPIENPGEEILLKIGDQLYRAFQVYLHQYKSPEYNELFGSDYFHPENNFTKREKQFYSKIISDSPMTRMWLAMQFFYIVNFVNRDKIIIFHDDVISFFNWITNKKKETHLQIQPSFQDLTSNHYVRHNREGEEATGGKYIKKYQKYIKKINFLKN
jgi:hypothetical protein